MATLASVDQNNYCNICFNNDSKLVSLCNNTKCNVDGKACVKCVEQESRGYTSMREKQDMQKNFQLTLV